MKKSIQLLSMIALLFLSSCNLKLKEESPVYMTFENDSFSVQYPKGWETAINEYPVRPFSAASGNQIAIISTRLIDDISIDSFVSSRIQDFEEHQWGFHLLEKSVGANEAFLHYENRDDANHEFIGTYMRIIAYKSKFYGIDCIYGNDAEKDTAENIVRSLTFKGN